MAKVYNLKTTPADSYNPNHTVHQDLVANNFYLKLDLSQNISAHCQNTVTRFDGGEEHEVIIKGELKANNVTKDALNVLCKYILRDILRDILKY